MTSSDLDSAQWIGTVELSRRAAFVRRHRRSVTSVVVGLSILACTGLAAIAGWHATSLRLDHLAWGFVPLAFVAHLIAYAGYLVAHHQVVNRSRATSVGWMRGAQMVAIGF